MNPLATATVMLIFKSDIGQQDSFRSAKLALKSFNIQRRTIHNLVPKSLKRNETRRTTGRRRKKNTVDRLLN